MWQNTDFCVRMEKLLEINSWLQTNTSDLPLFANSYNVRFLTKSPQTGWIWVSAPSPRTVFYIFNVPVSLMLPDSKLHELNLKC